MVRRSLATVVLVLATGCADGGTPGTEVDQGSPRPTPSRTAAGLDPDLAADAEAAARAHEEARARRKPHRLFGADASWPQCPKGMGIPEKRTQGQPMPTDAAEFVVLGLTNGPSFTPNPCLADQVDWVRERGLMAAAYSVVSYPDDATLAQLRHQGPYDGDTRLGALRNVGHQAALFNLQTMEAAGLISPIVWIDVEPVAFFEWSRDRVANAAVVEGVARGYTDAGLEVGYYSTPLLWETVVGDARFGGPEWRAAGETSMDEALRRCGEDWSIQGGPAVMGQWVEDNRDRNVTCPGLEEPASWFHQY